MHARTRTHPHGRGPSAACPCSAGTSPTAPRRSQGAATTLQDKYRKWLTAGASRQCVNDQTKSTYKHNMGPLCARLLSVDGKLDGAVEGGLPGPVGRCGDGLYLGQVHDPAVCME